MPNIAPRLHRSRRWAGALAALSLTVLPAAAMAQQGAPAQPRPGDPTATPPEKKAPDVPAPAQTTPGAKPGEPLGKALSRTDGVIHPPATGAPDMRVPAPDPTPGTTPVIPPPGSPGNPSSVRPK